MLTEKVKSLYRVGKPTPAEIERVRTRRLPFRPGGGGKEKEASASLQTGGERWLPSNGGVARLGGKTSPEAAKDH